jgi:hypothetical protein
MHKSGVAVAAAAAPARELSVNQCSCSAVPEHVVDSPLRQFGGVPLSACGPEVLDLAARVVAIREPEELGEPRETRISERDEIDVHAAHLASAPLTTAPSGSGNDTR